VNGHTQLLGRRTPVFDHAAQTES